MKNLRNHLIVGVLAMGAMSVPSYATLIGIDLEPAPDITSAFQDVIYDATSDTLSVSGFAITYDTNGVSTPELITAGMFALSATINDTGTASAGSLVIGGAVGGVGPMLLMGDLVDFGFSDGGGQLLEFAFEVTGGDLALAYGGVGGQIGVVLDMSSGVYTGDWSLSFDNLVSGVGSGAGISDTGVIPTPSVLAMMLSAGLGYRRRRRCA